MLALFTGMPGVYELAIILVIVLVFFGKRLPETMFSLGKSITEFKKGVTETENSEEDETKES